MIKHFIVLKLDASDSIDTSNSIDTLEELAENLGKELHVLTCFGSMVHVRTTFDPNFFPCLKCVEAYILIRTKETE